MADANPPQKTVAAWLTELQRQGKSPHTITAYRRGLEHFIGWNRQLYGDIFDPARVIPRDVRNWKGYQQTVEQAAPATINQRLVALSRFYRWAIKQELSPDDPTEEIRSLHLPSRQPQALSDRDLRRLLRQAKVDQRDYALIELLVGTGLRVGELLALRVGDIHLGERSGQVIVRRGKQGGYREIPLTLDVRQALIPYLETHPEADNPKAPLWLGAAGALKHRSSISRILDKYALRAGLEVVNPHALRHTFATRYLAANPGDLRGLARLLGHANLNTVMIYTEPTIDDLVERMERVESEG